MTARATPHADVPPSTSSPAAVQGAARSGAGRPHPSPAHPSPAVAGLRQRAGAAEAAARAAGDLACALRALSDVVEWYSAHADWVVADGPAGVVLLEVAPRDGVPGGVPGAPGGAA
jgi:hypothetical protein